MAVRAENQKENEHILIDSQEIFDIVICVNVIKTVRNQKVVVLFVHSTKQEVCIQTLCLDQLTHETFHKISVYSIHPQGSPEPKVDTNRFIKV